MSDHEENGSMTEQSWPLGGKYLTFYMADEEFGLEILKVREIIGLMVITPVPRTADFIMGVINLRGKVIPVIDLRRRFEVECAEATEQTCVIVVDVGNTEIGVIVDRVSEVLDIPSDQIEEAPSFGVCVNTDFILGIGKRGENVTILLDIEKVLMNSNLSGMDGSEESVAAESLPGL